MTASDTPGSRSGLQCALAPRSVAVIGASDNIHKMGGRPIHYMLRQGYQGRIYPINPSRPEIQGLTSHASLAALPEAPELALVIVGGDLAISAVDECIARGVRTAVVIASGFAETGPEGRQVQAAMTARARAAGMRLIGPNTQGIANFGTGAIASFSTMFVEIPPKDGPIAVVSQSGGMSSMIYGLLRTQDLGVRHVHATGNEADVGVAELALEVARDPDLRLLLLYLESLSDPARLAELAAVARDRDLPIVAVKSGHTAVGQRAAASHTGALANEDRVVDAFFRHHGIWRVADPHALALAAPGYLKGWRPAGRRVVVLSNSGASCVMGADISDQLGLPLAPLAPATQAAIAGELPGFATSTNPIDVTAALLNNSGLLGQVLPIVAEDPAADLFLLSIPVAGAGYDVERFARDAAACEVRSGKPLAVAAWQPDVARPFRELGLATFANETQALGVLAQIAGHSARRHRTRAVWPTAAALSPPTGAGRWVSEAGSLTWLAAQGLPVVAWRLCRSREEAGEAFDAIGAPAVMKGCSAEVPHKTEHGLVQLGVRTRASAESVHDTLSARLTALGVESEGVIVAATAGGRHEFMVGARIDPAFGPVVVVGEGGRYVEALGDVAVLLAPFDEADVLEALAGLRIAPVLAGVRGEAPADTRALAALVVRVGRLISAATPRFASIDLNPVRVGAEGEGVVIVDALIERAASGTQPT